MSNPTANDVRKASMKTLADAHVVYIEAVRKLMGEEGLKAIGDVHKFISLKDCSFLLKEDYLLQSH